MGAHGSRTLSSYDGDGSHLVLMISLYASDLEVFMDLNTISERQSFSFFNLIKQVILF